MKTDEFWGWGSFADVINANFFPHGTKILNRRNNILYVIL